MKIKELKKAIAKLPDDMEIILQKDSEGNGYSPLSGVDPEGIYIPDSTYSGNVKDASWSAEDADMSEEEWADMKRKNKRCLVLFPIN